MKFNFKTTKARLFARQGFTLVELLVVIAIIGLLSTFATVSLNQARTKARDAKRQVDNGSVFTALQLYYDNIQRYPTCACSGGPTTGCWDSELTDALYADPEKPYIAPMPVDPKDFDIYTYKYCSNDGKEFFLEYELEATEETKTIRGFE